MTVRISHHSECGSDLRVEPVSSQALLPVEALAVEAFAVEVFAVEVFAVEVFAPPPVCRRQERAAWRTRGSWTGTYQGLGISQSRVESRESRVARRQSALLLAQPSLLPSGQQIHSTDDRNEGDDAAHHDVDFHHVSFLSLARTMVHAIRITHIPTPNKALAVPDSIVASSALVARSMPSCHSDELAEI
jgi:hypothetical protein